MDFEAFKRTPQSRQKDHDDIALQIEAFLEAGGEIRLIPAGLGKDSPVARAFRIKSEKTGATRKPLPKTKTARAATLAEIPTFATLYPRTPKGAKS